MSTKNTNNPGPAGNTALEKRENTPVNVTQRPGQTPGERPGQETYYTPLVDVIENNDAFIFQADLPSVQPGEVDVTFENGVLTLEGKVQPRQPAGHPYVWQEYGVGHFYRSFNISTPVNVEGIRAELKNGELRLYVPKAESAKTRRVPIQGA